VAALGRSGDEEDEEQKNQSGDEAANGRALRAKREIRDPAWIGLPAAGSDPSK
jgi:hypothetical protein